MKGRINEMADDTSPTGRRSIQRPGNRGSENISRN